MKRYQLFLRPDDRYPHQDEDRLAYLEDGIRYARDYGYAGWRVLDAAKSFSPVPRETVLRVCDLSPEAQPHG